MKKSASYKKSEGTLKKRRELGMHLSGKEFSLRIDFQDEIPKRDFGFVDLGNGFRKTVRKK